MNTTPRSVADGASVAVNWSGTSQPGSGSSHGKRAEDQVCAEWSRALAVRLRAAAGGVSTREIAGRTGMNREMIRRQMQHGRVCARFLAVFCREFKIDANWLLAGDGTAVRHAPPVEPPPVLMSAMVEVRPGRLLIREARCEGALAGVLRESGTSPRRGARAGESGSAGHS